MNDASIIGKNSPLSAYVKLTFDGFTTGEIPPKYVLSFENTKIKDLTGNFSITLLYAPNTFKQGDDYLGLKLAALFNHLNTTETATNGKFTVPCTLEYGWHGTGIKVAFKQAVITGYSEDIDDGAFVKYSISGTLSGSSLRASQTQIMYDLNNDGAVDVNDNAVAIHTYNSYDLSNDIYASWTTDEERLRIQNLTGNSFSLDTIKAGTRLSDKIEFLAKYIFDGMYDVKVDHTDEIVEEDTPITQLRDSDSNKSKNDTLYQKLVNMIDSCYSMNGYDVTYTYYNRNTNEKIGEYTEHIESDQSIEESVYFIGPGSEKVRTFVLKDGLERTSVTRKIEKSAVKGERYTMFFIDGDSKKYGKPTIRICPKSATATNAQFAHYTISNTNRYNNVISYSHDTNLIPLVTAFNNIFGDSSSDVDVDTGEFIFSPISSLTAINKDNAREYAHNYALTLLKNLDNTTKASMSVVFDRYSPLLGIDDRITVTNTINGGEGSFNGDYYIYSAKDVLNNGMLETHYELIYTNSNVEKYVEEKVLQLMYELKPELKSASSVVVKKRDSQVHGRYTE